METSIWDENHTHVNHTSFFKNRQVQEFSFHVFFEMSTTNSDGCSEDRKNLASVYINK